MTQGFVNEPGDSLEGHHGDVFFSSSFFSGSFQLIRCLSNQQVKDTRRRWLLYFPKLYGRGEAFSWRSLVDVMDVSLCLPCAFERKEAHWLIKTSRLLGELLVYGRSFTFVQFFLLVAC